MNNIIKTFLIIMAVLVAMAIVVVGSASASVNALQRSSADVQSLVTKLNSASTFSEFSKRLDALRNSIIRLRNQHNQHITTALKAGDADMLRLTNGEYQQQAVRIKTLLVKEIDNSEFPLDRDVLTLLDDVDAMLHRAYVID